MQRVATGSQIASLPAVNADVGTPGFFDNQPPGLGVTPTVPGPDWFNRVQEELVAPVTGTGQTLGDSAVNQLLLAIKRIAGGNVTAASTAGITTLTPDDAGLVLVNAAAGNMVLDLPPVATPGAAPILPLHFRFVRTDASANTVSVAVAGADQFTTASWGALTGPLMVVNGAPLDLAGDGVSHWLVNAEPAGQRSAQQILATGTFTAIHTGLHRITCQGAGGGASGGTGGSGGAGECRRGWIFLTAGQSVACVVGVGGALASNSAAAGNGGLTSFGSYITANGGTGGAAAGGAGGSGGSGGSENYQGENGIDLDGTLYVARGGNAPLGLGYGGFQTGGANANPPSGYGAGGGADTVASTGTGGGAGLILVEV